MLTVVIPEPEIACPYKIKIFFGTTKTILLKIYL